MRAAPGLCAGGRGAPDDTSLVQCPAGIAGVAKSSRLNWSMQTVPQPGLNGRKGFQPRGKVLGGSSSVNAMIYLRGQPQDFDAGGQPKVTRLVLGRCEALV